jgi:excisionase family DNA binding protein
MNRTTERIAVDLRAASEMLSVSRRTLENYIRAKLLPARKLGRRRLILVRDLETSVRRDQPSPFMPKGCQCLCKARRNQLRGAIAVGV